MQAVGSDFSDYHANSSHLPLEQEQVLLRAWHLSQDFAARNRVVLHRLPFATQALMARSPEQFTPEEAQQEAALLILQCLATYAPISGQCFGAHLHAYLLRATFSTESQDLWELVSDGFEEPEDPNPSQELREEFRHRLLHRAILDLDEKSRDVIQRLYLSLETFTVEEVAALYNTTPCAIRRIHRQALDRLRDFINGASQQETPEELPPNVRRLVLAS